MYPALAPGEHLPAYSLFFFFLKGVVFGFCDMPVIYRKKRLDVTDVVNFHVAGTNQSR